MSSYSHISIDQIKLGVVNVLFHLLVHHSRQLIRLNKIFKENTVFLVTQAMTKLIHIVQVQL